MSRIEFIGETVPFDHRGDAWAFALTSSVARVVLIDPKGRYHAVDHGSYTERRLIERGWVLDTMPNPTSSVPASVDPDADRPTPASPKGGAAGFLGQRDRADGDRRRLCP